MWSREEAYFLSSYCLVVYSEEEGVKISHDDTFPLFPDLLYMIINSFIDLYMPTATNMTLLSPMNYTVNNDWQI